MWLLFYFVNDGSTDSSLIKLGQIEKNDPKKILL